MAIKVRHDVLPVRTNIVSTEITRASRLVSGITGFQVQPNKAIVGDNAFQDAFVRFKALADAKKAVFDEDIVALVDDEVLRGHDRIQVKEVEIYCGSNGPQRAILTLEVDGEEKTVTARGNGPVDALFNAIRQIVPPDKSALERYEVHAVTGGTDAQAEVSVLLSEDGRTTRGRGAHQDTMVASAKAYVNALNKLIVKRGRAPVDQAAAG
jgi:2-isopropylmalate synthase